LQSTFNLNTSILRRDLLRTENIGTQHLTISLLHFLNVHADVLVYSLHIYCIRLIALANLSLSRAARYPIEVPQSDLLAIGLGCRDMMPNRLETTEAAPLLLGKCQLRSSCDPLEARVALLYTYNNARSF